MPGVSQFFKKRSDREVAEAAFNGPEPVGDQEKNSDLSRSNSKEDDIHSDQVSIDAAPGVQKAEAITLVWDKKALYITYVWIWVCFFMLAFQSAIGNNVIFYAYADFSAAPQVSTAGILATIIGGVLRLPLAKTLTLWGRCEGFLVFVVVYLIGIIIIASCTGPSSYAAGYVLYWIGYDMIYMILDVFIADTSGLRNRAFAFAFASTPFICTAFTGPLAAQSFLTTGGWRWAYGAFAIIQVFVFVPLAVVFKFYEKKAEKLGQIKKNPSGRTIIQSIVHYIHDFDVVGAFILMAAFILFLLPFSLEQYGRAQYKSATFIAMVVIGVCLFPVFAIWEKFFARTHFVRWELFKKRTVVGACCLAAILYFSFYCWDLYYVYFVTVVYNLSTSDAGYMGQIYNVGSCFWGVVFGVWIRYTKHFKYTCLCFGLPLMFLGAGLMIRFRGQDSNIGYIIMCQIFIAFAGGTMVIGEDMAVMAAADQDGIPMMLALIGLFSSVGGSIGYAVAAAINANVFVDALTKALPAAQKDQAYTIYLGGVTTQTNATLYPVGSEARDAINYAWGQTQRDGAIAATCILVLAIPAIAVWKNYNVDKKQIKGTVF
ncbi:Siderochrome iron transporter 2 [Yamadazyma tenuis]|uniref:MFS general substrate transporter n=1 Tax=Candida tenuis (strain ATCC 10573 / BCRC 21748 / CBS 615 / JCM 9827 / NBRC 10315 / NRRL Y-1498 / VKM Y-70) TaxID=590646 RepID=G3B444_CANTC|nr:MFS general substrate transporter [Yamadazyma tenuis ATCC 10573]EGV63771.1 MFS general substrate transporter [Yamadazyma tenuis ATCC 10573]WEJ96616.1 Siderochrome iron transporter 2 [Yamadazyma tenuis]